MASAVLGNFALAWFGRETLSDMVMALISFVTIFVQGGYITQNIFRDTSLNKHGIHLPEAGTKYYLEQPSLAGTKEKDEGI
jgi:hypothetical protein